MSLEGTAVIGRPKRGGFQRFVEGQNTRDGDRSRHKIKERKKNFFIQA